LKREERIVQENVQENNSEEKEEEGGLKPCMRRVELPVLEGVDSQGWGSRAEKFLAVHHVSTMEKLKVVFHPNHWCKFWRKNSKKSSC